MLAPGQLLHHWVPQHVELCGEVGGFRGEVSVGASDVGGELVTALDEALLVVTHVLHLSGQVIQLFPLEYLMWFQVLVHGALFPLYLEHSLAQLLLLSGLDIHLALQLFFHPAHLLIHILQASSTHKEDT